MAIFLASCSNSKKEPKITIEKQEDGTLNYENVTITYSDGTTFKGKTDEDLNYIEGEFFYSDSKQRYIGSLNKEGQPEGYGKMFFEDGAVFDGNWINGQFRGQGKKLFADGSSVEGNFVSDEAVCGNDSHIIWANGASYCGTTDENGVFNGNGKYIFSDGTSYEGAFVDNRRSGFGVTDYKGSTYIGTYQGDLRTGKGDFKFYNGYEYKGNFQQGTFCGTGYLLAQEKEKIIYASNDWNGADPKKGKIITENGDIWEGGIENSKPIAGTGIWTTQEERLARLKQKGNHCQLVSYTFKEKEIIVASVYTPDEVNQIIHSANYLRDFDNFYKAHKETIEKVIRGMQVVTGILAVAPTPIAPFAAAANVALSALNISLKTMDASFDVYDALKSGNDSILKNIALEYGKDIAADTISLLFMGTAIDKGLTGQGAKTFQTAGKELAARLQNLGLNPTVAENLMSGLFAMSSLTSSYANEFFEENPSLGSLYSLLQMIVPIDGRSDEELRAQASQIFDSAA